MAAFALLGNRQGVVFPWASRQLGMIQNTFELWAAVHVFASAFNDRGLESRSSLPGEKLGRNSWILWDGKTQSVRPCVPELCSVSAHCDACMALSYMPSFACPPHHFQSFQKQCNRTWRGSRYGWDERSLSLVAARPTGSQSHLPRPLTRSALRRSWPSCPGAPCSRTFVSVSLREAELSR